MKTFGLQDFDFKPYSCRRGGATNFFIQTGSMELTLARGRWGSSRVARIYINDGLAMLASLTLTPAQADRLHKAALHLTSAS